VKKNTMNPLFMSEPSYQTEKILERKKKQKGKMGEKRED